MDLRELGRVLMFYKVNVHVLKDLKTKRWKIKKKKKKKKKKDFDDYGPVEKAISFFFFFFFFFTILHILSSKWVNVYILGILMSEIW